MFDYIGSKWNSFCDWCLGLISDDKLQRMADWGKATMQTPGMFRDWLRTTRPIMQIFTQTVMILVSVLALPLMLLSFVFVIAYTLTSVLTFYVMLFLPADVYAFAIKHLTARKLARDGFAYNAVCQFIDLSIQRIRRGVDKISFLMLGFDLVALYADLELWLETDFAEFTKEPEYSTVDINPLRLTFEPLRLAA